MDPAADFATHFARLLSLRVREPESLEAHRVALDELLAANAHAATLVWDNWQLRAGDDVLGPTTPGVLDLLARMAAHGIRELSFGPNVGRAHLLGVIWILEQDPVIGDGGARAMSRLRMLGAATVRMIPVIAAPEPAPAAKVSEPAAVEAAAPPQVESVALPEIEERVTAEVLVARLAAATEPDAVARAFDAMATFTELPRKRIGDVVTILLALMDQEPRFTDDDTRRAFGYALKRIAKATTFRALAAGLSTSPERHDDYMRILAYFGDAAADEAIEQLAFAESSKERRVLFDALVALQRGVPTLIYLLGDGRWYVARNAAELLGEMRAAEAEQGLAWLLNHPDVRVRRSATAALAQLETPGARAALRAAMKDESPAVRMHATMALASAKERAAVPAIFRALADEQDPEVQRMLMSALGRIGSPEAIQHLIAAAEPERGMFKKKPMPLRLAAIAGLAESDGASAVSAIRALTNDKERDIRDAATRALTPKGNPAVPDTDKRSW